jgi:hypothetical protein
MGVLLVAVTAPYVVLQQPCVLPALSFLHWKFDEPGMWFMPCVSEC